MNIKLEKKMQSDSFCILPWIHMNVMPDSTVIPCCISPYSDIYGDGNKQSLAEIWNSEKYKEMRLKMLQGKDIPGCSRCKNLEKTGFKSLRQEMNYFFKTHLDIVNKTQEDGSLTSLELKYLDIRFSNLCNFKCRGCGPSLSSSWFDDYQNLYPVNSVNKKLRSISAESPTLWAEISELILDVDVIYFAGGEPLITKEHYEILTKLNSLKLYDVELRYNTNLSQLNYLDFDLPNIWKNFKKVSLSISIDDIKERAEYFRHGTRWDIVEKNFDLLINKYPNVIRSVNCTVNIMNVLYLPEIYEYLISKNYIEPKDFNINLLLDPVELRIDVLPSDLKKIVLTKLTKFKFKLSCLDKKYHPSIIDIDNIINFLYQSDNTHLLPLFRKSTLALDRLRNENFQNTFPELIQLLDVSKVY